MDKLSNPKKYAKKWDLLNQLEKNGLIEKWTKDLLRNTDYKNILKGIIKSR